MSVRLLPGDCIETMRSLPANSVDSVVTDPPYHLLSTVKRFANSPRTESTMPKSEPHARMSVGFMGKTWDGGDIAFRPETWTEVLRVLKPGGHLVAFGAPKNYHRLACAIEDAGFEVRDALMWLFGSGFPKSHDAAQSIEKLLTTGVARRPDRDLGGLSRNRFSGDIEGGLIANTGGKVPLTTPEAQAWQGWGTALKPAYEPIILARKPIEGTNAENVLRFGVGALNIDGCRVEAKDKTPAPVGQYGGSTIGPNGHSGIRNGSADMLGRWPANVIHDGSDEVLAAFPDAPSQQGALTGNEPSPTFSGQVYGQMKRTMASTPRGDAGSAARFFYCAKANKKDRAGSKHPTVKPIALMRYLCRLITPPGGTILDPFAGSGTTGQAASEEGFNAILCEREAEYIADINRRLGLEDAMSEMLA